MRKTLSFILVAFLVFIFSGCSLFSGTNTVAKIQKAMLAAELDDEVIPVDDAPDGFDPDSDKIIFVGKLDQAKKNKVKVEWINSDTDKTIKTKEKTVDDDGGFAFDIARPTTGWIGGDYNLLIYINDKKIGSKKFAIQTSDDATKTLYDKKNEQKDTTKGIKDAKADSKSSIDTKKKDTPDKKNLLTPKSNPTQIATTQTAINTPNQVQNAVFINASMCNALNADNSCQSQVEYYYDNAKTMYASTQWQNLKTNDNIMAVWYWEGYNGQGQYISSSTVDIMTNQSGYISFILNNTGQTWYSGSYWVEIYYNGAYFTTIPFAVYSKYFEPTYKYPQSGYYDVYGNYILYDGTGYYDIYGNFWNWGTDWYDEYPESGYYDEYGNYILDDGTGYYDFYGNFWTWQEVWGDGWYDENGNYYLADGSGYLDIYGNFWPIMIDTVDMQDGYYDPDGYYILNDGSGYYDPYGNFWTWDQWYGDGYYDIDGNYVLYDGTGYYDPSGAFWPWEQYAPVEPEYADGYYDSYGNYILYDGTGYYDPQGNFYPYEDYVYDDYYYEDYSGDDFYYEDYYFDDYSFPNGDMEYWDESYYPEAVG